MLWKKNLMSLSEEGLLREINSMMALQMVLDYRAERHLELIEFAESMNAQMQSKMIRTGVGAFNEQFEGANVKK